MATKMKFSHRAGGRYYWTRPAGNGYEEQVSCSVLWFWGWVSGDDSLPACGDDCDKRGFWGATGMMPDGNHCLVITKNRQYLAHREP